MPNGSQFDDDDQDLEGSDLVKDLRKQLKDRSKREAELETQLKDLGSRERQRTLSETLTTKGLNPKVAKFYPADAELTEDAVDAWIGENADLFGVAAKQEATPATGPDSGDDEKPGEQFQVDPATEAAYRRMHAAHLVGGSGTTREADLLRGIANSKDPEELTALLRSVRA